MGGPIDCVGQSDACFMQSQSLASRAGSQSLMYDCQGHSSRSSHNNKIFFDKSSTHRPINLQDIHRDEESREEIKVPTTNPLDKQQTNYIHDDHISMHHTCILPCVASHRPSRPTIKYYVRFQKQVFTSRTMSLPPQRFFQFVVMQFTPNRIISYEQTNSVGGWLNEVNGLMMGVLVMEVMIDK